MKANKTFSLLLFLLTAGLISADTISLDEILKRHTEAVGGKEKIEAVKSIEIALTITEPSFTVDGIYRADRSHRMRIDIYSGNDRVFTEGYDGNRGWQQESEGKPAEDASPEGSAKLKRSAILPGKLHGLHEMAQLGNRLELTERELVEGIQYYVLRLTLTDGEVIAYYINPDNWLMERSRSVTALHVDVDPTKKHLETRFSDFRPVDGVLRAFKFEEVDLDSGQIVSGGIVKTIQINPTIDPAVYQKP